MGCNRDGTCLNIYSNIYPNAKATIDSSINNINGKLNEIVDVLNGLIVPEDYLGNKVKKRISEICTSFYDDSNELLIEKSSIDSFIDNQIEIHKQHYNSWRIEQERLARLRREKKTNNDVTRQVK